MIEKLLDIWRRRMWAPQDYARFLGVKIGDNCDIDTKFFGSEPYLITIGNHVQVTNDVKFFTHGGGWIFRERYPNFDTFGKITIKDNVYIGNNAMLLPGVTIGNNVIIGAGSVVTKSVGDNTIVAGNPAKVVGRVDELEQRMLLYNVNTKGKSVVEKRKILESLDEKFFIKK